MNAEVSPGRFGRYHTVPLDNVKGECKTWSCELPRVRGGALCLTHEADLEEMLSIARADGGLELLIK